MVILTLAVSLDSLRPPTCSSSNPDYCSTLTKHYQIVIFFLALYIIALGAGGTKPNIQTLGAEQFDVLDSKERARKFSFFNWWTFAAFCGNLFSTTVLIYIQNSVSWSIGYGVPTAGLSIAIAVFLLGSPFYRHKPPSGSPVVRVAKVLVAAVRNWSFRLPEDPKTLHELDSEQYGQAKRRIDHSSSLRFLDKAAVKTGSDGEWHLCSVTQVEETKQIIKLLPIFAATIVPSVMLAQVLTLFIKQGTTLDRRIGPRFSIPPGNLSSFFMIATIIVIPAYDRGFVPLLRKYTNNPRGITMLQRIGLGLFLHVLVMVMASFVEKWRLTIVRSHGLAHQKATVPLTVFALAPQFVLMGVAEVLVEVGKMEFFYDQAPQGMKSLGSSFYTSTLAMGNFMSSLILSTTAKITREGGRNGWIENNLNASRLDNYYLFFAVLNVGNLLFFFVVSSFYAYNREGTSGEKELKHEEEVFPDEEELER
ncbi:hypothetical protein HPP92_000267 [Vanilla planifolia]|uniref:Uncharacterized protein n=1 Tax=Vanilla planifolia TaxID=51239 RepID=A0A835RNU4_VANPL|nr:hypothetical protein HPP92_000267 [Vanilla planifolia]